MFRNEKLYLALALVTTATVSCGGGSHTAGSGGTGGAAGSTSTASSASSSSSTGTGGNVPEGGMPCPKSTVLAVNKLYFGEGNSGQWKTLGFNLDGKVSTAASTDLCKVNSGGATPAPSTSVPYPDGNNGIDNSFGKNILPLILGLDPTWVTDVDSSIQQGQFTALLELECLPPAGDVPVLTTKLFAGTTLGTVPKWDGTDQWPVEPDLLSNPKDPESSSLVFPQCSVMGTTFDAGKNGTIVLTIPIMLQGASSSIKLTLYSAQLTMTLAADRKSATGGLIGGVLNTEEFVAQVNNIGALLGLCNNVLLTSLVTQVRQASDIMADGSQDPSKTCDGISVGLGFDMQEAQIGAVGPAAPAEMTCP